LYSLGVLLYRLVTGAFPVRAATLDELRAAHAKQSVVRLRDARPDLPTAFVRVVDRAITSDPEKRYASAGELAADLAATLDQTSTAADAAPRHWPVRWTIAAAAVLAAVVITLVSAPWSSIRGRRTARVAPGTVHSIAVLPLMNVSGDVAQEYFADGLTDE